MNKHFDIYIPQPKKKSVIAKPIKARQFGLLKIISVTVLTLFLVVALVPLFQAFEAHVLNVTADLVQIDAPVMTPPGPVAFDDTNGGNFSAAIDVYIVEFDPDATHIFYTFGPGTDPNTVTDPYCGDVLGGTITATYHVPLSTDGVIKAIACNGATTAAASSAINTKIFSIEPVFVPPTSPTSETVELETKTEVPPVIDSSVLEDQTLPLTDPVLDSSLVTQ